MVTFRVVIRTTNLDVIEVFDTTTERLSEHEAWAVAIDWLINRQLGPQEQAVIKRWTSEQ